MGLTEKILEEWKQGVSSLELVPSDGGRFEVFVNDVQIYSKLETGEFPEWPALKKAITAQAA